MLSVNMLKIKVNIMKSMKLVDTKTYFAALFAPTTCTEFSFDGIYIILRKLTTEFHGTSEICDRLYWECIHSK